VNANRWQRTGFGVGGLLALTVLFLGIVMLSNLGLRGMRLDLTQNRLYTLSPGTTQVLAELNEPINLYFYFSRDTAAKQSPLLMPYATRVREYLEEITARAGGIGAGSGILLQVHTSPGARNRHHIFPLRQQPGQC
jgi:ABC-type uncharacterized transport system involved in gliding motility auxiliary subunit